MPHLSVRVSFAALLLGLALLAPATATTYVMMPDEALVDSSPLIVEGRVVAVSGAPVETPSTDYRVEILRLLKGRHPGAEIVVRQLGGVNAEGRAMKIWGLTRLGIGDRALLFLVPRADGTYGVNQLILGAFREVEVAGQRVAVRDLEAATELRIGSSEKLATLSGGDRPRDVEGFSRWIEHRVEKRFRPADYFRDGLILPKFNLFADASCGDGRPIRWFNFDSGGSVSFTSNSSGQPGLADGGVSEIQAALAAWTNDPGSPISYTYGGSTASTGTNDNIVFEDPNAIISGSFSCSSGGVVAVGGPSYSCSLQMHNGQTYHPTQSALVVTQDGIGCLFSVPGGVTLAQEMFAHELGHTLGLGQIQLTWVDASTNEDTFRIEMNSGFGFSEVAVVGPNLTQTTVGGLSPSTNYSFRVRARNTGGDSTYSNTAAATTQGVVGSAPSAPTNLQATPATSSSIQLTWFDNAADETSFVVEMRPTASGVYAPIATPPANATSYTATGLTASTSYTFRVKAHNAFGDSATSNEAAATTLAGAPTCDPSALCLANNRFAVTATFDTTGGIHGTGQPIKLTADTGYFWFFAATNVEVVIKVLDACTFTTPAFWVFAGGLTDVHAVITVTDLVSGQSHQYVNPIQTKFQPIQDTGTFLTCGAH